MAAAISLLTNTCAFETRPLKRAMLEALTTFEYSVRSQFELRCTAERRYSSNHPRGEPRWRVALVGYQLPVAPIRLMFKPSEVNRVQVAVLL